MKTLAELKRDAAQYTWELYCFNKTGIVTLPNHPHKFINQTRKVEHVQSNAIRFEGGSWLEFPKASQCSFEPYMYDKNDVCLTIKPEDEYGLTLKYHLRKIA